MSDSGSLEPLVYYIVLIQFNFTQSKILLFASLQDYKIEKNCFYKKEQRSLKDGNKYFDIKILQELKT